MKGAPKDGSRKSADDRTTVHLRGRWVGEPPGPESTGAFTEWVEFVQQLDGNLHGFTATLSFELIDGRVYLSEEGVTYRPSTRLPLDRVTNRALRDLRLGDVRALLEERLTVVGALALPWVDALASERRRAGRHGTPPLRLAQIAAKRVEAEQAAPGNAIRYMRQTWPDLVGDTDAAVYGRVNRAIRAKGGPMLERDGDGNWQLTTRAIELLRDQREDST